MHPHKPQISSAVIGRHVARLLKGYPKGAKVETLWNENKMEELIPSLGVIQQVFPSPNGKPTKIYFPSPRNHIVDGEVLGYKELREGASEANQIFIIVRMGENGKGRKLEYPIYSPRVGPLAKLYRLDAGNNLSSYCLALPNGILFRTPLRQKHAIS